MGRWGWPNPVVDRVVAAGIGRALTPFFRRLRNARRVQRAQLFDKVRRFATTSFGREHRFGDLRSVEDFRRNVSIAPYDAFRPYLERVVAGDDAALLPPGERVRMFVTTSGTTGRSKLLPATTTWTKEYLRSTRVWATKAVLDHPGSFHGLRVLSLAGNPDLYRTEAGLPCGLLSGLTAVAPDRLTRGFHAVPVEVASVRDAAAKTYLTLRLAMAGRLRVLTAVTPTSLVRLARFGDEHRESLIRDIADGTLSPEFGVPSDVRRRVDPLLRVRRPARARELDALVSRTGRLYPRDYWDLALVSCWLGGTVGVSSRAMLSRYYGEVAVRDLGLVASEGRMTIPLEDGVPAGVLDATTHYYEFIPEEEYGSSRPTVLECHELDPERTYFVVLTTSAGLFRYDIGDRVRCVGYFGEAPLLEFLDKGGRVSDLEGEKLNERQLVEAVADSAGRLGWGVSFFTAVPERPIGEAARYAFAVEEPALPEGQDGIRLLEAVDHWLVVHNPMYAARRGDGCLGPPRLLRVPAGTWDDLARAEVERRGTGDEQYKHPYLMAEGSFPDRFEVAGSAAAGG